MYARSVSFHLKPGRSAEFAQTVEKDIIPLLRKQKGFQDELAFVAPGGAHAVAISLWDLKERAVAYARRAYPTVLKTLEPLVEDAPEVETYEVSNSTFHKVARAAA
jgi:hypothetical protein